DPNETPFLEAPYGQAPRDGQRRFPADFAGKFAQRRRFQLSVEPLFASLRVQLVGRPDAPDHGGGVGTSFAIEVWRPRWRRLSATYSGHPVGDRHTERDDEIVHTAGRGTIHIAHAGGGAAYAFDFGRVLPIIDVGLGGLWVVTPQGVADGQRGRTCTSNSQC